MKRALLLYGVVAAGMAAAAGLTVYPVRPLTMRPILPDSQLAYLWGRQPQLRLTAARDEYEPASLVVCPETEVKNFLIRPGDLRGPGGTIPASAVDVRVVKCWYQGANAGEEIAQTPEREAVLVPELLLYDDALIRVDREARKNYRRLSFPDRVEYDDISFRETEAAPPESYRFEDARYPVYDARTLQPVTLEANRNRQFWITVHVPADAAAGDYTGTLDFTADGEAAGAVELRVTVLPFELAVPATRYDIDKPFTSSIYHLTIVVDGEAGLSPYRRSRDQYAAELRNLKAHGIANPISSQLQTVTEFTDAERRLFLDMLRLRRDAGMDTDAYYTFVNANVNYGPDMVGEPDALPRILARVRTVMDWLEAGWGHRNYYMYGPDEARGERLIRQLPVWRAVHEIGGKIMVSGYNDPAARAGNFELVGEEQDLLICAFTPDPAETAKWHSRGKRIWNYANPQAGVENPKLYRLNYGLRLYLADYDGAADFTYYISFGDPWNDFDSPHWRDHNFVYPTADGVVDTLAWEGYREGIDDIRYATTLRRAIRRAADKDAAAAAEQWFNALTVDAESDLDAIRAEMIRWILKLE